MPVLGEGAILELNDVGKLEVHVADQTTDTIILPMVQLLGTTTLSAPAVLDARTITVTVPTGFVVGQHIRIINAAADRYYFGTILGIVGSIITLDSLLDFAYVSGSEVTTSNINMAVDGSTTPVIFTLRTGLPSIPADMDITRMIITCECLSAVALDLFGDLSALTKGILFRSKNGTQHNIFNVKSNQELENITLDWKAFTASNPAQGTDGFSCRLTFSGPDKLGFI
jgi:hypothetical protein